MATGSRTSESDEVIWYAQDEVNQEDSEQNEVDDGMNEEGSWFHR